METLYEESSDKLLVKFDILKHLDKTFLNDIRLINIFGYEGNEVFILTHDDQAFSFGNNSNSCLGLGHYNRIERVTRVNELCNKRVSKLSFGNSHALAITSNGRVYSWGLNSYGQLAHDSIINEKRPKLIECLAEQVIVDMSCGEYHSLMLTSNGEVFACGYNQFGQTGAGNCTEDQLLAVKVKRFSSEQVIQICCGGYHSMALTQCGQVFAWGQNTFGQLGIGNTTDQCVAKQLTAFKYAKGVWRYFVTISKISCGRNHSVLLSINGDVFACGWNKCAQIGCEPNNTNAWLRNYKNHAIKISSDHKFVDICATIYCDVSVALSLNGSCFVWGKCGQQLITTPRQTSFTSIEQVFVNLLVPNITPQSILFQKKINSPLIGEIEYVFNDKITSDIAFKINNEYIYAHKRVLTTNCDYFRGLLSEHWDENNSNSRTTIELSEYSYETYYRFLKYIYTGDIDITSIMGSEVIISLLDLANYYCEQSLKQKLVNLIKQNNVLTIDNVCDIYSFANLLYDLISLKQFLLLYILHNFRNISKTDGFIRLNDMLRKYILDKVSIHRTVYARKHHFVNMMQPYLWQ